MSEFFPAPFLFEGTPFEMNRVMLIRLIATVAVVVVLAVFFGILFWNVTKLIPFLNMPGTGVIGLPLVITLVVYVTYHWAGIAEKGLGRYLKDALVLPGVPPAMHILLIPIEFITKFVT